MYRFGSQISVFKLKEQKQQTCCLSIIYNLFLSKTLLCNNSQDCPFPERLPEKSKKNNFFIGSLAQIWARKDRLFIGNGKGWSITGFAKQPDLNSRREEKVSGTGELVGFTRLICFSGLIR